MSGTELIWKLLFDVVWGMILGGIYFGGLWLNVKRIPMNPVAVWLVPLSFFVRITLVILGIAWVGESHPLGMIAAVVGIMITRQLIIVLVTKELNVSESDSKGVLP